MKVDIETKRKAIEGLALLWENGPKNLKQAESIIGQVYRFSHLNGTCGNPHLDWHKECREFYDRFGEVGLI